MSTKLRIKIGAVEVEYEGSDEFLKTELPELLKVVLELHESAGPAVPDQAPDDSGRRAPSGGAKYSASTIAAKLGGKSGGDLALAAAAALVFGDKESFSRAEILKTRQGAKAYYKTTYRSNLSNCLTRLVKSQALLDHGNDQFGLQDANGRRLRGRSVDESGSQSSRSRSWRLAEGTASASSRRRHAKNCQTT